MIQFNNQIQGFTNDVLGFMPTTSHQIPQQDVILSVSIGQTPLSKLPIYKELIAAESAIPLTTPRHSTDTLNLTTVTNLYMWYDHSKVVPVLACGCIVVINPSELTPLTALVATKLTLQAENVCLIESGSSYTKKLEEELQKRDAFIEQKKMTDGTLALVKHGQDKIKSTPEREYLTSVAVSLVERFLKKPTSGHSRSSNRGSNPAISSVCYDPTIKNALIVEGRMYGLSKSRARKEVKTIVCCYEDACN
ncbi:serine carboxypeptidase-like 27 [Artemisia annua]|uniref:Serine carboxypeptidase-like 27 n=1 Tax=Artemisia annua TaxID=35608 RepID=A0A2U1KIH3_ARTAN|nr:serine carboxypeptidase-like 27 [Artemisia annua]